MAGMLKRSFVVAAVILAAPAWAQDGDGELVRRSTLSTGVQVQGNAMTNTNAADLSTTAIGRNNQSNTAAGSVQGDVQIQGNVRLNTNARDINTTTQGQNNTGCTKVGAIGDTQHCK